MNEVALPSSFRDPAGHLFFKSGSLFRQVNAVYKDDYDFLMSSGLFEQLVSSGLLVAHKEVDGRVESPSAYKTIQPEMVDFISYPYEWSFGMLKEAALALIEITVRAIGKGMILKDATAFNFQFHKGRMCLIDTLSFERYREGEPWVAYKQFCQHFFAPLVLASDVDIRLTSLNRNYIDGVPLDLAASLLPFKSKLRLAPLVHIVMHSKAQSKYANKGKGPASRSGQVSKLGLLGMLDNLKSAIEKLEWKAGDTEWGDYYSATNYSDDAFSEKAKLVERMVTGIGKRPELTIDLGGNTGVFSRVAAKHSKLTVSADVDPVAVEKNYRQIKRDEETNLIPLLMDLTNPSPSLGWASSERDSFIHRKRADLLMALALIHHLVISNNVPMKRVAELMATMGDNLIIEFVPKEDSQVQRLLSSRKDIFPHYDLNGFLAAFSEHFTVLQQEKVTGSERTLFLLRRK